MLKEALEDAIARGDKIRQDITKEILNSQIFADLANNPRFVNAVARVIRSKAEVARSLQKRVKETLQVMKIPTREQIRTYERRVAKLEREIDTVTRRVAAKKAAKKKAAKKATKKKVSKKRPVKKKVTKKKVAKKKVAKKATRKKATQRKTAKKKSSRR